MTTTIIMIFLQRMFKGKSIWIKLSFELIAVFFTLAFIYYASRSFSLNSTGELNTNLSLFTFLFVGEISLILPMSAAERWLSNLVNLKNQHFYQTLLGLKISPFHFIFTQVLTDLVFPLGRIFFMLFGAIIMGQISLSLGHFFYYLLIQICAIATFIFMAVFASMIYLKFNKGLGFFYTFQSLSAILGGAYFPTSIFPLGIKNLSFILPQTQILVISRAIFSSGQVPIETYFMFFFWPIFLVVFLGLFGQFFASYLKKCAQFF